MAEAWCIAERDAVGTSPAAVFRAALGSGGPAPWPGSRLPQGFKRSLLCLVSLGFFGLNSVMARCAGWMGLARPRLVVLYYHAVPISYRRRFAAQLDRILAAADAVVPADFCAPAEPGMLLVAITFDDAFQSVVENAVPELHARGMPATIFTPSGLLGRAPGWEMEPGAEGRFDKVMDPDTLRAIATGSIAIGAHGVTHLRLAGAEPSAAEAEIAGSRASLVGLTGRAVHLFSFPYGAYDATAVQLCQAAGYRFVFTIAPHVTNPASDAMIRGRVAIRPDDTLLEFWLKIRGGYGWLPYAQQIKRRLFPRRVHGALS